MDVVLFYQLTANIITLYGYCKIANTSYNNYKKTKILYENTIYLLNKIHSILYKENCEDIKIFEDKDAEFFTDSFNEIWEILNKDEIVNEIESEHLTDVGFFTDIQHPSLYL